MLEQLMERLISWLAVAMMATTGCTTDSEEAVVPTAVFQTSGAAHIEAAGYANDLELILTAPAGTSYTIRVEEGSAWCSLKRDGQLAEKSDVMSISSRVELLYLRENGEEESREGVVRVAFSTGEEVLLTLRQRQNDTPPLYDRSWPEVPAYQYDEKRLTVAHYASLTADKQVRNYTLCFDTEKGYALWVAYPLHKCYMNGTYSRTNDWAYDPKIPIEYQPNLERGSYRDYNWVRGHQLMSNHRYVNYSDELNAQTFYSTNIMPQDYGFNSGLWNEMEVVCTTAGSTQGADTLYCVTGAHGVQGYTSDKAGKPIAIPSHCFKVLLKARSSSDRTPIHQITDASQLKAIGYWAPNSSAGNTGKVSDFTMSVAEVERLTGHRFFPMLNEAVAEQVKGQHSPSDWGIR